MAPPSLRVRRGSSSALRTRLDGNEPGCHVRTRTGARGSKSRPRSSPTTSLRAVAGPRSSFPHPAPALRERDPQACRSYSLLYSRNECGGETRIGPLTNREVFVTESELGRAALSLASFFVAKHFTPSPLQSHPPQWTLPRPACAHGHTVPIGTVYLSCCMGKSLTWGSHSSGTRRPLNTN